MCFMISLIFTSKYYFHKLKVSQIHTHQLQLSASQQVPKWGIGNKPEEQKSGPLAKGKIRGLTNSWKQLHLSKKLSYELILHLEVRC